MRKLESKNRERKKRWYNSAIRWERSDEEERKRNIADEEREEKKR